MGVHVRHDDVDRSVVVEVSKGGGPARVEESWRGPPPREKLFERTPPLTYEDKVGLDVHVVRLHIRPPEPPGTPQISIGAIRRVEIPDELRAALEAGSPAEQGHVLAASGIWYDAFDFFFDWIDDHPQDAKARSFRASLLEQVGLLEVSALVRDSD